MNLPRRCAPLYLQMSKETLLPIRWLSPEAYLYGKFSVQSDVYAFGVLLWETFTFGLQPYYGYTNREVTELITKVGLSLRVTHGLSLHVTLGLSLHVTLRTRLRAQTSSECIDSFRCKLIQSGNGSYAGVFYRGDQIPWDLPCCLEFVQHHLLSLLLSALQWRPIKRRYANYGTSSRMLL